MCMEPQKHITAELLTCAFKRQFSKRFLLMLPNVYLKPCPNFECDLFCVRNCGISHEIEIKVSTENFKADSRKADIPFGVKTKALADGRLPPNFFSYLLPDYIVNECRIPDFAGLYVGYWNKAGDKVVIAERRLPRRLHKRVLSPKQINDVRDKSYQKFWSLYEANA